MIAEDSPAEPPAVRLRNLARTLGRLAPSSRDPERYHVDKNEIVATLREIARTLDWRSPKAPLGPPARRAPAVHQAAAAPASLNIAALARPLGCAGQASARFGEHCRHCRWRRAKQSYRHRLRLPGMDLFQWAERREGGP